MAISSIWEIPVEAAREYNAVIAEFLGRTFAGERITLNTSSVRDQRGAAMTKSA